MSEFAALRAQLQNGNVRPFMCCHQSNQYANRTTAEDQCVFAGNQARPADIVHSHGNRFNKCAKGQIGAFRQAMDTLCRHDPTLLKGAITIKSQEFEIVANVAVSRKAGRAETARFERADSDRFACYPTINVRTYCCDGTLHFVPDNSIGSNACIHRAMKSMQVCPADAAIGGFYRAHPYDW